jgi:HD-like signal output (HDOD) protein
MVQSAAMAFAVQQMKDEESLRPIAPQLSELWKKSIAVASICQVVARRTKIDPDEAFLAGLLHGIGRLYILARAVGAAKEYAQDESFMLLIADWHATIGKAVLETWGFAPQIALAVNDQADYERKFKHEAELSDVLIVSILLADALQQETPRIVNMVGIAAFQTVSVTEQDCASILSHAELTLGSLQEAFGC